MQKRRMKQQKWVLGECDLDVTSIHNTEVRHLGVFTLAVPSHHQRLTLVMGRGCCSKHHTISSAQVTLKFCFPLSINLTFFFQIIQEVESRQLQQDLNRWHQEFWAKHNENFNQVISFCVTTVIASVVWLPVFGYVKYWQFFVLPGSSQPFTFC